MAGHCHTGALFLSFSCVTMGQLVFSRNLCADGDHRSRIDILTDMPLFSNGDLRSRIDIWPLLPVCAMVHQKSLFVQKPASGASFLWIEALLSTQVRNVFTQSLIES